MHTGIEGCSNTKYILPWPQDIVNMSRTSNWIFVDAGSGQPALVSNRSEWMTSPFSHKNAFKSLRNVKTPNKRWKFDIKRQNFRLKSLPFKNAMPQSFRYGISEIMFSTPLETLNLRSLYMLLSSLSVASKHTVKGWASSVASWVSAFWHSFTVAHVFVLWPNKWNCFMNFFRMLEANATTRNLLLF